MMMQHYLGIGDIQVYLKELMATGNYDAAQAAFDNSILTRLRKKDPKAVLPKNKPVKDYLNNFIGILDTLPPVEKVEAISAVTGNPMPPVRQSNVTEKKSEPKIAKPAPKEDATIYNPNPTFGVPDLYPNAPKKQAPTVQPATPAQPFDFNNIFPISGIFSPSPLKQKQEPKVIVKPTPTVTQPVATPKKEEKTSTSVPGSLIDLNTITDVITDVITNVATSKVGEVVKSAIDQGIGAAASQLWAGISAPNEGLQQPIKPLPEKEINVAPGKTNKVKPTEPVKEKPPAYIPLGSKVNNYKGDANRYLEPFKVSVDSAKFGVRSRGETRDVQTKGVVFTTYKPWTYASSPEFTKGNDAFNYFLLVDNSTGELKVTTNPKQNANSLLNSGAIKANPNMLTTGSYGRVVKELNMNGLYNNGIGSKTLGYVSHDGKKASIPVFGIGNGSDLGGYIGGKLLLAHPDGSNPTIIYGSAEIVIDQFNKYKKENNLQNVLVVDADGKSYAQSYQTKNNIIPGSVLTSNQWDNANTSSAGSGNILYLK